jgi:Reverse transcriptase (RNA-dependent DNA polymerase)
LVWKLKKAMYGLKQAGREWYNCLSKALSSLGWLTSQFDPCIWTKDNGNLILGAYVDDILITGNNTDNIEGAITDLETHFAIKRMGEPAFILGCKVVRETGGAGL